MRSSFLFFALSFLISAASFANNAFCPRIFTDLGNRNSSEEFWERATSYKAGKGSRSGSFKFGFDAEMWSIGDCINVIAQSETAFKGLERKLKSEGPHYTLAELNAMVGSTGRSALRSGIRREDGEYVLTDLKVEKIYDWAHSDNDKSEYADLLWEHVNKSLKNRKIPVQAILEEESGSAWNHAVELVMKGAKSKPKEFRKIIDWLFDEVDSPELHVHVSVPVKSIEPEQMIFAARALETKILLDQVVAGKEYDNSNYAPFDNTTFTRDPSDPFNEEVSLRGIVRVDGHRWSNPEAHDVEIRDWWDKENAMENAHFLMEAVRNAKHLRDSSDFMLSRELRGTMPPNLNGGLRYAAYMLKDRLPANKAHIATDLEHFAQTLENEGRVNSNRLSEIRAYLKQHNVLKYLSLETFLEKDDE